MNIVTNLLKNIWTPIKCSRINYAGTAPFTIFLQNQPCVQYAKLYNGLTIATDERESYNACIGLFIDAGSRYESNFENGVAHFFEHIAFKGTRARTKYELEAQMSCLGAYYKCFTTRELVCYYVQCLCQDTPLAVDILTDCVFNNAFSQCDIEYQKRIVYGEMIDQDSDTEAVLYDYLHSTAFQGTPLAHTVMGPTCNLYNFTDITICRYLSKCFDPCRTVLTAVGGVKHEQIVALANTYLCRLDPLKCLDIDTYRYSGSEVRYRDDTMPTAHVLIAVEGPCFCEDDNVVMEVARHIIGGWDRSQPGGEGHPSRVARTASGGKFCDSYKTFNINYKDCGLWGVHYVSDVMRLDDMMMLIQEEFMYLSLAVTEPEVERAKNFVKSKLLSDTESNLGACMDIGRWTLYHGYRPTVLQRLQAIDRITAADVRRVCHRYLYDRCPVIVAIGPTEGLFEYGRYRSNMYWLRY